jgi:hypothetical protein
MLNDNVHLSTFVQNRFYLGLHFYAMGSRSQTASIPIMIKAAISGPANGFCRKNVDNYEFSRFDSI